MAFSFAGQNNTFVPSHEATGSLVVGFSRNVRSFQLPQYALYTKVPKPEGYYLQWTSRQAARVRYSNLREFVWADNQDRPSGNNNLESFQYVLYETKRYNFPFSLGRKAVNYADWQILAAHSAMAAQQAMTARTLFAYGQLSGASWGSNSATATAAGGGLWSAGTEANPYILNSINTAMVQINLATIGAVGPNDCTLVVAPNLATVMGESAEIHSYLKSSPYAMDQIRGDVPNNNGKWGLPDVLYGLRLVVDCTVQDTSRKNSAGTANDTLGYVIPKTEAYIVARPGALEGIEGSPNFSTLQFFMLEEMTVETMDDVNNRRIMGSVVDDFDCQVVTTSSGYKFTSCQ